MEFVSWGVEDCDASDSVCFAHGECQYEAREAKQLKAMGALISVEADSMSAMKYR